MSPDQQMRIGLPAILSQKIRETYHAKLPVGDRLPPERTLAEKFEVSLPTLREALAVLAREGWLIRKQGSGNYISRPSQTDKHIGLLVEMDYASHFLSSSILALALKIRRCLEEQGKPCKLYFGHRTPSDTDYGMRCPEFLEDVQKQRLSCVMALAALLSDDWRKPLANQGVPVIGGNSLYEVYLGVDRERWVVDAVAALKAQNKRRVGLIYWGGSRPLNPGMRSYQEIFRSALQREGLEFYPQWVRSDLNPSLSGAGWEEFREVWQQDSANRPDAMVITDEVLLEGGLWAAADLNLKLPDDLLIAALTSDFRPSRAWAKILRLEWSVDQVVDRYLHAVTLQPEQYPVRIDIPFSLRMPVMRTSQNLSWVEPPTINHP